MKRSTTISIACILACALVVFGFVFMESPVEPQISLKDKQTLLKALEAKSDDLKAALNDFYNRTDKGYVDVKLSHTSVIALINLAKGTDHAILADHLTKENAGVQIYTKIVTMHTAPMIWNGLIVSGYVNKISAKGSNIREIDLKGANTLNALDVEKTSITRLDVSSNKNLVSINASRSKILKINLKGAANLKELDVSNTDLKYLDVSSNKNLVCINANYSKILEINFNRVAKISGACPRDG